MVPLRQSNPLPFHEPRIINQNDVPTSAANNADNLNDIPTTMTNKGENHNRVSGSAFNGGDL